MLPETVNVPVEVNVQVAPVVVNEAQAGVLANVIVGEPELALTMTGFTDVGTLSPPVPPEVNDQFVVVVVFQVPEPPTQYIVALDTQVKIMIPCPPDAAVTEALLLPPAPPPYKPPAPPVAVVVDEPAPPPPPPEPARVPVATTR